MMNWAKQQLANVAGTQEPIYGPSAIQPVTKQAQTTPYTELSRDDLRWIAMESTCVETQTFYITADSGHMGLVQVIYSNVAGIRTTCQFNTKIFYPDGETPNLWSSDPLDNYGFDATKHSFHAKNCSVNLSEDGTSYAIKSSTNRKSIVDLKVTRVTPGFVVGKNGTSYFGTNPQEPWGSMRHAFWPRCRVEGDIVIQQGAISMSGVGLFVHALQGMKPHHAGAARWNFVNFQSPTYSAIMMEYTTPPSYGSTVVNVGGIATGSLDEPTSGEIIIAGASNSAMHTTVKGDPENNWPEPAAAKYTWEGRTRDGKVVHAEAEGGLGQRLDRVDIMAEVPKFVKQIVAGAAGTKPYIYQYAPKLTLRLKIGDEERQEEGILFTEATFIS